MSISTRVAQAARRGTTILSVATILLVVGTTGHAQNINWGNNRAVGGVSIDAGKLTNASVDALGTLRKLREQSLQAIPGDMKQMAGLRKVSLRRLEAAIQKSLAEGKPLPDAIQCLAGLQQIRYVFVYPEQNDIVLAGPAEGWKVDRRGNLVGATTGRPVMYLDDLVVALRAAGAVPRSPMACSIDPTPDGIKRVDGFARQLRPGVNPDTAAEAIRQQLGPQKITVSGVPATSHFARVMVAADYRMKRVSMNVEPAPVAGLSSFVELVKLSGRGMQNLLPRWWLEPDYQPLLRDPEGLAWELRGAAVKTVTELDFFDENGVQHPTGRADPIAQRWAENMTSHYEELSLADPIFGELRNCMDLAVVAALVSKENLAAKANNRLPLLTGSDGLPAAQMDAPKEVDPKATLIHKGKKWAVAAGGVQINPWAIADKTQQSDAPASVRGKALANNENWWWD
jgi:hypothetical protein